MGIVVMMWGHVRVAHHIHDDYGEDGDDDDEKLTEVMVCMAHHIDSGMEVYNSLESFSTK